MAVKAFATAIQKENFKTRFAEIVKNNEKINNKYTVQFFDTAVKSNYVFQGTDGKSINIMQYLSIEELDLYRTLKNHWQ